MKNGKASGPSCAVTKMLASSDICSELTADLTNSIIRENVMSIEWGDSFIFGVFKGKGDR